MTKHMLIAAGLVLCACAVLATGLTSAAGGGDAIAADQAKPQLGAHIVPAERALAPLQASLASPEANTTNPFTMARAGEIRSSRLPFPPPPPLDLPPLPLLPISER